MVAQLARCSTRLLPTPASLAYPVVLLACHEGLLPPVAGWVAAVGWVLGVVWGRR